MRAPTGEVAEVPAEQVEFFRRNGAVLLGSPQPLPQMRPAVSHPQAPPSQQMPMAEMRAFPSHVAAQPMSAMRAPTAMERVNTGIADAYEWAGNTLPGRVADLSGMANLGGVSREFRGQEPLPEVTLGMMPGPPQGKAMTKAAMAQAPLSELTTGLWHPIGAGKKLEIPLSEMESAVTPHAGARGHRVITPAEMEGATIIPLTGDRARAQATLTGVGGAPLRSPVALPGGPDFMLEKPGSGWASARAPIEKLAKKVREGGDGRTFGMYVPGSHAMVDFSTTFADALLEQVATSKVTKKSMQQFDAVVRRLRPEWKGLAHPDARKQLDANGELRLAFTNAMGLGEFRKAGFPDLAATRAAVSEPALMNTRPYEGGFAIAELDPGGKVIRQPQSPHPTYTTELGGHYAGQFPSDVPIADLFPTFTQGRRAAGADPMRDIRSFMLSNPTQVATPQWVDKVSQILAKASPRVVDYLKKYGVAATLGAGLITEAQARQLQALEGQEQ
jgi:hypothetical protein